MTTLSSGTPKSDKERAIDHFLDGNKDKWDELSADEKADYISKLPSRGTKMTNDGQYPLQTPEDYWSRPDNDGFWSVWKNWTTGEGEDMEWHEEMVQDRFPSRESADMFGEALKNKVLVLNQLQVVLTTEGGDPVEVHLTEEVGWEEIPGINAIKIFGTLIAEGVWSGIDGATIYYPRAIFNEAAPTCLAGAIKRGHKDRDVDVVGFITATTVVEDKILFEGIIFQAQTIEDIMMGVLLGISMEALVWVEPSDDGTLIAQSMNILMATIVEKPACKTCFINSTQSIILGDNKMTSTDGGNGPKEFVLSETQLEAIGSKLEGKIEEYKAALEQSEADKETVENAHLAVVNKKNKEIETMSEDLTQLQAQLKDIQEQLTAKVTELEAAEKARDDFEAELAVKATELEAKDNSITELQGVVDAAKTAEVNGLLEEIKKIQADFDEVSLLEGVTCLDSRAALLKNYLASLAKLQITSLSVQDNGSPEEKVKAVLVEMGIGDVDSFIQQR